MNRLLIVGLLIIASPMAAAAQSRPSANSPKPSIGIFGLFDFTNIASPKSFDAAFGKHTTTAPGVGVDAINLWKGLFVRVDGSRSSLTGERVIVFNSDVFKLGIPLTAQLTPIEFGGGWRFQSKNPSSRITPYVGVAAVMLKYKETSSFADSSENVDESYSGFGAFGGVDIRIVHQVFGGIEAQYRSINIAPGANSAAASFNEKNLGGTVLRVRLGVRF